jgi:hypothetical protein
VGKVLKSGASKVMGQTRKTLSKNGMSLESSTSDFEILCIDVLHTDKPNIVSSTLHTIVSGPPPPAPVPSRRPRIVKRLTKSSFGHGILKFFGKAIKPGGVKTQRAHKLEKWAAWHKEHDQKIKYQGHIKEKTKVNQKCKLERVRQHRQRARNKATRMGTSETNVCLSSSSTFETLSS